MTRLILNAFYCLNLLKKGIYGVFQILFMLEIQNFNLHIYHPNQYKPNAGKKRENYAFSPLKSIKKLILDLPYKRTSAGNPRSWDLPPCSNTFQIIRINDEPLSKDFLEYIFYKPPPPSKPNRPFGYIRSGLPCGEDEYLRASPESETRLPIRRTPFFCQRRAG